MCPFSSREIIYRYVTWQIYSEVWTNVRCQGVLRFAAAMFQFQCFVLGVNCVPLLYVYLRKVSCVKAGHIPVVFFCSGFTLDCCCFIVDYVVFQISVAIFIRQISFNDFVLCAVYVILLTWLLLTISTFPWMNDLR